MFNRHFACVHEIEKIFHLPRVRVFEDNDGMRTITESGINFTNCAYFFEKLDRLIKKKIFLLYGVVRKLRHGKFYKFVSFFLSNFYLLRLI